MTNILFTLGLITLFLSLILAFLGTAMTGLATIAFGGGLLLVILALLGGDDESDNTDDPGP